MLEIRNSRRYRKQKLQAFLWRLDFRTRLSRTLRTGPRSRPEGASRGRARESCCAREPTRQRQARRCPAPPARSGSALVPHEGRLEAGPRSGPGAPSLHPPAPPALSGSAVQLRALSIRLHGVLGHALPHSHPRSGTRHLSGRPRTDARRRSSRPFGHTLPFRQRPWPAPYCEATRLLEVPRCWC